MASGGSVCMIRTERDMLLVSSEAFSESMMSERWYFRWEAGDNGVKLDAGIKGRRFMSSCVRWRCIGGVACGVAGRKRVPILSKANESRVQNEIADFSIELSFCWHKSHNGSRPVGVEYR